MDSLTEDMSCNYQTTPNLSLAENKPAIPFGRINRGETASTSWISSSDGEKNMVFNRIRAKEPNKEEKMKIRIKDLLIIGFIVSAFVLVTGCGGGGGGSDKHLLTLRVHGREPGKVRCMA
jgi:hypothetical protein